MTMLIRILDVVLSSLALTVLSPILLPIIVVLRLTGEGEIFFRQERVGRDGRQFYLLKFATMLKDSPNVGTKLITLRDDPRVLPVGRVLRKTKLNELPQLVNILKGDMSIIGPRPQAPAHFDVFPELVKKELIKVRPGLSGIGSVVFRNEEELLSRAGDAHDRFYREVIAPYKGQLELWFIENKRISLYIALIVLTLWIVVFPHSRVYERLFRDLPKAPPGLRLGSTVGRVV